MWIIGLVGGSGSGKGVVGRIFEQCGYLIYDTDAVYHEMTSHKSDCTLALSQAFGDEILNEDGSLDRRALAARVFASGETAVQERVLLNQITHRYVKQAFDAFLLSHPHDKIVLDAPLLFEAGMDMLCHFTLAVLAPIEARIERIMKRDNISRQSAVARINSQISDEELTVKCDFHIVNDGTLAQLYEKTNTILKLLNERIEDHE